MFDLSPDINFGLLQRYLLTALPMLVNAVLLAAIGWFAVKFATNLCGKFLKRTKIDPILHAFILSICRIAMLVLLAISVLDVLGVPTTSLITSLGAVGLAVSLAIKDSISNLAGGVVLLLVKPFALGDYIEMGSVSGTVTEIGLVNTILTTPDNKRIYIPNDIVSKSQITNFSAEPVRRLQNIFSIGYNDDFDQACEVISKVLKKSPLVLTDPAPVVRMFSHSPSSIDIVCRVWVNTQDYFELDFWLKEQVKRAFDEAGIAIPYNQLDVHITNTHEA